MKTYYQRRHGEPSARALSDVELAAKITGIHAESKGTYGSARVHKELLRRDMLSGRRRVTRLMCQAGMEGRCKKRWRKTAVVDPGAEQAENLSQRAWTLRESASEGGYDLRRGDPGCGLHRRHPGLRSERVGRRQ